MILVSPHPFCSYVHCKLKCWISRFLHFSSGSSLHRFSPSSTYNYLTGLLSDFKFLTLLPKRMKKCLTNVIGSLLLRRECCTFSNGEYVKSGLAELEKWIVNATEEVLLVVFWQFLSQNLLHVFSNLSLFWMQFAGTSWHELNYIRQAVGFLV